MPNSPARISQSPPRSPEHGVSPKKEVTRYGPVKGCEPKFGTEKRFMWQNAQFSSDVAYDIPDAKMSRSIVFGSSLREGLSDNPDAKTRTNGPGSYDLSNCYDHLSEYGKKEATRFSNAARQSMAMKTPSPGAVYNIEKVYYNGPDKGQGIGFGNSTRQGLFGASASANADLFIPKYETGNAVTIAKRFKRKDTNSASPGPVYDVHVSTVKYLSLRLVISLIQEQ